MRGGARGRAGNEVAIVSWLPRLEQSWVPIPRLLFPSKFAWLGRVCFWLTRKLGGEFERPSSTIYYSELTLDLSKLADAILDSEDAIYRIWHEGLRYVLVGHQELLGLRKLEHSILRLDFAPDFKEKGDRASVLNGLHVILVPWMKGVVVLPDVF